MTQTRTTVTGRKKRGIPEGTWIQCPDCKSAIFKKEAQRLLHVCPGCEYHMYVSASERIEQVLDSGTFEEWDQEMVAADPLEFTDSRAYVDRIKSEQKKTGLKDAVITGCGMIRALSLIHI